MKKGCLVGFILTLLACGLVFGVSCLIGWIFMLLWNAVIPLFGVTLTFWQAWCLSTLIGFIGNCFRSDNANFEYQKKELKDALFELKVSWNNLINKVPTTEEKSTIVKEEIKEENTTPVETTFEEPNNSSSKKKSRRRYKKKTESSQN